MAFTDNDLVKVDIRWQVGTICQACNVFQAKLDQVVPHNLPTVDGLLDMGNWMTRIFTPMWPHIVVSVDFLECSVYKRVGLLWNYEGPAPVVFTPASIDDPLPSGVAALIVAYTGISKVIGKKYIVGLAEAGQTAGLWVAGVLAAMLQSAIHWIGPFQSLADVDSFWTPGVWSAKALGYVPFAAAISTRDVPAYQRRRKAGVGI